MSRLVFSIVLSNYHSLKAETMGSPQEWNEMTAQITMCEAVGNEIKRSGVFTTGVHDLKDILEANDFISLTKFGEEGLTDEEKRPVLAITNPQSNESVEFIVGDDGEM